MILRLRAFYIRYDFRISPKAINHIFLKTCNHHVESQENNNSQPAAISSFLAGLRRYGSSLVPGIFTNAISTCAKLELYSVGVQIHGVVIKMGFNSNVYIGSALVDMHSKCGSVTLAHCLFDEMPERNEITWNSLISGYLDALFPNFAMGLFIKMLRVGISLTPYSISSGLVGCAQLEDAGLGSQIHGLGFKLGFGSNTVVGTGLVDMYSKTRNIEASRKVFDGMPDKNIKAWTSLITGYAYNKMTTKAMILLKKMFSTSVKATDVTYNCLLSALTSPNDQQNFKEIHCRIVKEGFDCDNYIIVTLLTAYPEHSCSLKDFLNICSTVTIWDQISWNAVISGFSTLGFYNESLTCFSNMSKSGIPLDIFTYLSVLKAIGTITALKEGKQTHGLIVKSGYDSKVCVQNGLVSMYARCGNLNDAKKVFVSMDSRDVISWNSLLSACGNHGYGKEALELFDEMQKRGTKPNLTTFLIVLSACSHFGLVEKGLECFNMMKSDVSITPSFEHYTCMVDLYARAGHLDIGEAFIKSMPVDLQPPPPSVYKALLNACQVHGNKEIAIRTARTLAKICPNDPATYVVVANIMAIEGNWNDATCMRKIMHDIGVKKVSGFSLI